MPKSTSVAKEALSYCTSCKMDLNHVIVAMKGDKIAKVQCLTCKKEHAYKAPKGVTSPDEKPAATAKKPRKTKESSGATPVQAEWEKLMAAQKDTPKKSYSAKSVYVLSDKIAHPSFGEGVVSRVIYPNKVEVVFQMDVKILIHGGSTVSTVQ